MIVSRAPLRVSLAGGGSDLPDFFAMRQGAVLGFAVSTYVYVALLPLASIAGENVRFTYRHSQSVQSFEELQHPVVREALRMEERPPRLNIATMADVPGGTGLGSSSAFTVALLAALDEHHGRQVERESIAYRAIEIERDRLKESGGWQDQAQAAIGGFRLYQFGASGFTAEGSVEAAWVDALAECMVLIHVGKAERNSSDHQQSLTQRIRNGEAAERLERAASIARSGYEDLSVATSLDEALQIVAEIVARGWVEKRESAGGVPKDVDVLIDEGLRRGALAGKLCGAGGSGYVLFVLPEGRREAFLTDWPAVHATRVAMDRQGVSVLLHSRGEGSSMTAFTPAVPGGLLQNIDEHGGLPLALTTGR